MGVFVDINDMKPCITDKGVKDLMKLAEIVVNSHYSYTDLDTREDLKQVALLKAIEWLSKTDYDASRSSLKNVLYTCMRNECKNYVYRNTRDTPVDDEVLIGANSAVTSLEVDLTPIGIYKVPVRRLSDEDKVKVLESLAYLGFDTGCKKVLHKEVTRWVTLVIWKMLRL